MNLNINFDVLHEEEPWAKIALDIGEVGEATTDAQDVEDPVNPVPLANELNGTINNDATNQNFQDAINAAKTLGTGG